HAALGPSARAAGASGGGLPGLAHGGHRGRRAVGAGGDQRGVALPATVHVRQRGVPRRAGCARRGLLRDRLARRPVLPPRRPAAGGVDLGRVRACRGGRHRRRQVRRQLRLVAAGQAGGRGERRRRGHVPGLRDALSIHELSGMNVFTVAADGRLLTPSLTGSILEGVTRESILRLAADRGIEVVEQQLVMSDVLAQIADGEITEMFAAGTAAVINPIGELRARGGSWTVGEGGSGEVTLALRTELTDIQYGRIPDRHGWLRRLV